MYKVSGWKRVTYKDDSGDTWTSLMRDSSDETPYSPTISVASVEDAPELTAEEMLDELVSDAEGANYHEWCSLYGQLHSLVEKHGGTAAADAFIAEIFDMGGLHGR